MFSCKGMSAVLVIALLLTGVTAQAYQLPVEVFEYMDDVKVVAFIDKKDMAAVQARDPSAPLLTIKGALAVVKKHITRHQPEIGEAKLEEITFRKLPGFPGRWHYLVKLKNADPRMPYHYFVVLMNGKVIPAVKEIAAVK